MDDFEHGHAIPGSGERRRGYQHQPMSRERAGEVMIAFALATASSGVPIERRLSRCEKGYNALVPMEWIAGLPGVKAMLEALDR